MNGERGGCEVHGFDHDDNMGKNDGRVTHFGRALRIHQDELTMFSGATGKSSASASSSGEAGAVSSTS